MYENWSCRSIFDMCMFWGKDLEVELVLVLGIPFNEHSQLFRGQSLPGAPLFNFSKVDIRTHFFRQPHKRGFGGHFRQLDPVRQFVPHVDGLARVQLLHDFIRFGHIRIKEHFPIGPRQRVKRRGIIDLQFVIARFSAHFGQIPPRFRRIPLAIRHDQPAQEFWSDASPVFLQILARDGVEPLGDERVLRPEPHHGRADAVVQVEPLQPDVVLAQVGGVVQQVVQDEHVRVEVEPAVLVHEGQPGRFRQVNVSPGRTRELEVLFPPTFDRRSSENRVQVQRNHEQVGHVPHLLLDRPQQAHVVDGLGVHDQAHGVVGMRVGRGLDGAGQLGVQGQTGIADLQEEHVAVLVRGQIPFFQVHVVLKSVLGDEDQRQQAEDDDERRFETLFD